MEEGEVLKLVLGGKEKWEIYKELSKALTFSKGLYIGCEKGYFNQGHSDKTLSLAEVFMNKDLVLGTGRILLQIRISKNILSSFFSTSQFLYNGEWPFFCS